MTDRGGTPEGEAGDGIAAQLAAECNRLRAQRDAYAAAVRWYAAPGAYAPGPDGTPSAVARDAGAKARAAILRAAAAGRVTSI